MLFLQMACEKLCKARLIIAGTSPASLQSSHGYIANPLPLVIRSQLEFLGEDLKARAGFLAYSRHVAEEIELLNPAIDRNRQRRDNCEYPWEDEGDFHSPLNWQFTPQQKLQERFGPSLIKVLRLAISRVIEELA